MEMLLQLEQIQENDIVELEDKLNFKIPVLYRNFLLKYSGGQPLKNHFYKELDSGGVYDFEIDVFLGISHDLSFDIVHTYIIMLGRIPEELLPIADDGIGNKICICTNGKDIGKIYIWFSEKEVDELDKPNSSNVKLIAEDFNEFISLLR